MTPANALTLTRKQVNLNGQSVAIRRYTGTGPTRTYVDTATMGFVRNYSAKEIIGSIIQSDQVAVVLVDTLTAILPVRVTDYLMVNGQKFSIKNPMSREVGGVLISLEIHASGI